MIVDKEIESCGKCPFANIHWNANRIDGCNIGGGQDLDCDDTIDKKSILEDCPLKSETFFVRLKK